MPDVRCFLRRCLQPHWVAVAAALGANGFVCAAFAHGSTPEIQSVEVHGQTLTLGTNFGMLRGNRHAWYLTCEEIVNGPMIAVWSPQNADGTFASDLDAALPDAQKSDAQKDADPDIERDASPPALLPPLNGVTLTAEGVYVQPEANQCVFEPLTIQPSMHWLLSYAVGTQSSDVAQQGDAPQFALVVEPGEHQYLLRADVGSPFRQLAYFGENPGYRDVKVGAEGQAVYVSGYTLSPPETKMAYSLDGGEHLTETLLDFDPTSQRLAPLLVDPHEPSHLYLSRSSQSGGGVWRFDAETETLSELLPIEPGDVLAGVAATADAVYAAVSSDTGGRLYRAPRASAPRFERVAGSYPMLSCLGATETTLFLCSKDVSRASPFLVASSTDGQNWQPLLGVWDLGSLPMCEDCQYTSVWLTALFGSVYDDSDAAAAPFTPTRYDAGAAPVGSAPPSEPDAGTPEPSSSHSRCSCTVVGARVQAPDGLVCLVLVTGMLLRLRRRQQHPSRRFAAPLE